MNHLNMVELSPIMKNRLENDYFKKLFEYYQAEFYKHLSNFATWEDYRYDNHLHKTDKNYLPERILDKFFFEVAINYLEKYPFMKKYSSYYPEYKDYISSLDHYEEFEIETKRGGISVKVELFNVSEDDLYFPKQEIAYQIHSALHSTSTVIKGHSEGLSEFNSILIHEHPLTTHVGDSEYVKYFANKMNLPLVILTRQENLSFFLQSNGLPKLGHLGRYCTRIYKTEPSHLFYKKFFYHFLKKIELGSSVAELKKFAEKNNIEIPKDKKKKEDLVNFLLKKIEDEDLIPEGITTKRAFKIKNQKITPDNLVQCLGIASYQSKRRGKMNPELKLTHYADESKGFLIYEMLPIFNLPFEEVKRIFEKTDLLENPYDNEYRNLNSFYIAGEKEIRFGCIICPYKDVNYYIYLMENYKDRYYLDRIIKTIASAKNKIRSDDEYDYFREEDLPEKKKKYAGIM